MEITKAVAEMRTGKIGIVLSGRPNLQKYERYAITFESPKLGPHKRELEAARFHRPMLVEWANKQITRKGNLGVRVLKHYLFG